MEFDKLEKSNNNHGGKREGAGMPKGKKTEKTLKKEEALRQFQERVRKSIDSIANSQMNLALGTQYLFKIETVKYKDKNGKWQEERKRPAIVTDNWEIENYLAGDYDDEKDTYYFLTTNKPENKALDSLLDRAFGKAQQNIDIMSDGKPIVLPNELYGKYNPKPSTDSDSKGST